jgi:hypothetical protein
MSPNHLLNPTVRYAGLDVAKATFVLNLEGRCYPLENTPAGQTRLVQLLRRVPGPTQVVLEATGG